MFALVVIVVFGDVAVGVIAVPVPVAVILLEVAVIAIIKVQEKIKTAKILLFRKLYNECHYHCTWSLPFLPQAS